MAPAFRVPTRAERGSIRPDDPRVGRTTRRDFLSVAGVAGAAALVPGESWSAEAPATAASARPLAVSVFTKHLQYLDHRALAETVAEAGFDGIDLPVRAGG